MDCPFPGGMSWAVGHPSTQEGIKDDNQISGLGIHVSSLVIHWKLPCCAHMCLCDCLFNRSLNLEMKEQPSTTFFHLQGSRAQPMPGTYHMFNQDANITKGQRG